MGHQPLSRADAKKLAELHGTTPRSIRRYLAQGVDVRNPLEVVDRILAVKNPSVRQLTRSVEILKSHIESI